MSETARGFVAVAADTIGENNRQWIEVVPTADNVRNGVWAYTLDRADLEDGAAYLQANPDRIAIDYNHATMSGGDSVAAGWFTGQAEVVDDPARGPILRAEVEWTPEGAADVKNKRYRFISAEWKPRVLDAKAKIMTGIKAVVAATLTNRPLFTQLSALASELIDSDQLDALTAAHGQPVADLVLSALAANDPDNKTFIDAIFASLPKENHMPDKTDFTALAKSLGLAEDADETAIADAIKTKNDEIAALTEKVNDLEAKADVSDDLKRMATEGAKAAQELATMKVDTLITGAVASGKIPPVAKDAYATMAASDYDGTKALIDAMPEKSFTEVGSGGDGDETDDETKEIAAAKKRFARDSDEPVDGADLHVKAMRHLKEQGKHEPSQDEYAAALEIVSAE